MLMLFEEIIVCPDVIKLCPPLYINRLLIHVIDFRSAHGQKERGMCGNNKLTSEKSGRILKKSKKLLLPLRRKTVLRLIQQLQPVLIYLLRKINERAFSVGMLPHIIHQILTDIS